MHKSILAFAIFTVIFNNYCESKTTRTMITFEPATRNMIVNAMTECSKKESDVQELIQMMKDGSWREDKEFKTFMFCVFLRLAYADKDTGRLRIKEASVVFPDPEPIKKTLLDCDQQTAQNPVDPVETAFLNFKCFQTNTPYSVNLE